MKRILCGALSALLIFTGIQLPARAETAGTEETAAVQPEETAATEPVESVPEETQAPETIGPDANERAPQAMTVSNSGIAMLEELEGRGVSSFRTALTQVENSVNSFLSANGLTLTQQQFDALLPAAVDVILETGQASVSFLQRRLKLGYARAARIVDEMEERGIIGPYEGAKPRQLLITREQWEQMQNGTYAPPAPPVEDELP